MLHKMAGLYSFCTRWQSYNLVTLQDGRAIFLLHKMTELYSCHTARRKNYILDHTAIWKSYILAILQDRRIIILPYRKMAELFCQITKRQTLTTIRDVRAILLPHCKTAEQTLATMRDVRAMLLPHYEMVHWYLIQIMARCNASAALGLITGRASLAPRSWGNSLFWLVPATHPPPSCYVQHPQSLL